jgi:hypothetical protein
MASHNRHDQTVAALGRFWDAIARGRPADPGDLDPALAETVRRLHARDDAPGASAAFAARLLADLEDQMDMTLTNDTGLPGSRTRFLGAWPFPNGSAPPSGRGIRPPDQDARPLQWRPIATHFATAALVALTLVSIYLAFGPPRFTQQEADRAIVPAVVATPATPTPAQTAEPLATMTLPAGAVPDEIIGGQNSYIIPPGSVGRWDPASFSPTCCTGPRLNYVLSGSYTVRGGPMQVLRHGSSAWEEVPAGTELTLQKGDALLSRMEDPFDAMNPSQEPAEVLDGVLFAGDSGTDPIPVESSGRPAWRFLDQDIWLNLVTIPHGPVTLQLRQETVPAGGDVPLPDGAIMQLAVSLDGAALAVTNQDFSVHNFEQRPLTLYLLTLEPAPEESGTSANGTTSP